METSGGNLELVSASWPLSALLKNVHFLKDFGLPTAKREKLCDISSHLVQSPNFI